MVSVTTAYSATYTGAALPPSASAKAPAATSDAAAAASAAATNVTLSDAAKAAIDAPAPDAAAPGKDLSTVLTDARQKLTALLLAADRTSPVQDGKLALDMTTLDSRELFAIANDTDQDRFGGDEKTAAGLEMQRRFDAALAGPAAIADVTGNYAGLYKAAADYLDSLGPEERADPKTVSARAELTEGMKQLAINPKTLPDTGDDDPVALYLALAETGETSGPRDIADVASDVRTALDKKYEAALANGRAPTFNKNTTVGTYIDMSTFESRSLSAIVLNAGDEFSSDEVNAANTALRAKGSAALVAGFQNAAKSGDPTAFSQNMIGIYSSLSSEERQALGWSDKFYQTAVESFNTTSKLAQMFADASGGTTTGFMSWLGK